MESLELECHRNLIIHTGPWIISLILPRFRIIINNRKLRLNVPSHLLQIITVLNNNSSSLFSRQRANRSMHIPTTITTTLVAKNTLHLTCLIIKLVIIITVLVAKEEVTKWTRVIIIIMAISSNTTGHSIQITLLPILIIIVITPTTRTTRWLARLPPTLIQITTLATIISVCRYRR